MEPAGLPSSLRTSTRLLGLRCFSSINLLFKADGGSGTPACRGLLSCAFAAVTPAKAITRNRMIAVLNFVMTISRFSVRVLGCEPDNADVLIRCQNLDSRRFLSLSGRGLLKRQLHIWFFLRWFSIESDLAVASRDHVTGLSCLRVPVPSRKTIPSVPL